MPSHPAKDLLHGLYFCLISRETISISVSPLLLASKMDISRASCSVLATGVIENSIIKIGRLAGLFPVLVFFPRIVAFQIMGLLLQSS